MKSSAHNTYGRCERRTTRCEGSDMETYDCVIVGTGPAGLGAAFHLSDNRPDMRILMIDKESMSTGGLRNDCKMNFTFPIGFPDYAE